MNQTLMFAQSELKKYYSMMDNDGANDIQLIIDDNIDGYTGNPEFDDAFIIDVVKGIGKIVGSNPRSVLLGVYRYLTELGCAFFLPGKDGELIPKVDKQSCNVSMNWVASMRHRGVCIEGEVTLENVLNMVDYLPKIGCNSYFIQFREAHTFFDRWYSRHKDEKENSVPFSRDESKKFLKIIEDELSKRNMIYQKVGHGWTCECIGIPAIGWNQVDGMAIPEEFKSLLAEINGKREFFENTPLNTHLCYSNPIAKQRFVDEVVSYAIDHPEIDLLHVWLADNNNNICECENCRKLRLSDWYVSMLNSIDEKLTAAGNDNLRIVFLLYYELLWPPIKEKLNNPERFVMMFAPISRTYSRPYLEKGDIIEKHSLPEYTVNQINLSTDVHENVNMLLHWQDYFHGDSFLFDYHLMNEINKEYGHMKLANVIYKDVAQLHQLGLNGLISCQVTRCGFPSGFGLYVLGQTLFNPEITWENLCENYFSAAFGDDSDEAKEFLNNLSECFCDAEHRTDMTEISKKLHQMQPRLLELEKKYSTKPQARSWKNIHIASVVFSAGADLLSISKRDEEAWETFHKMMWDIEKEVQPDLDVASFVYLFRQLYVQRFPD